MPKAVISYQEEAIRALGLGLIDAVCVVLALPMLVFPWRLKDEWANLRNMQPQSRIPALFFLLLNTFADIFFILPLFLVILTIYRLPKLVKSLQNLSLSQ